VILFDVNVLLPACMPRAPSHLRCRPLVEEIANGLRRRNVLATS